MRTRSLPPPMLTRGIIRSVWLLKAAPSAGAGAAVQVPIQCVSSLMTRPFPSVCSSRPRLVDGRAIILADHDPALRRADSLHEHHGRIVVLPALAAGRASSRWTT